MKKSLMIAAVLAASVSIPALAQDSDDHRHGGRSREGRGDQMQQPAPERIERSNNGGSDTGGWRQRQAQAPAPVAQAPQAQQQQNIDRNAWRAQRQQQQAAQGDGGRRGGWDRGQAGMQGQTPAANGDAYRARQGWRGDAQGQQAGRTWDRNDGGRVEQQGQQAGRNWDRSRDGRTDWQGQQNGRSWDRNGDGRPDYRGNQQGQHYGDNRRFDHSRDNWNRQWRNDRRYDWQRYRSENRFAYRLPSYYAPYGWNYGYQRFSIGVYLNALLWDRDYWIDDASDYRLPPAYPPYRWVRYYNDALLIDTRDGYVVDTLYDLFW